MAETADWQTDLNYIVAMMRDLSQVDDPQQAAQLYSRRIREGGLFPVDGYIAVSRRGLEPPQYRITRSFTWKQEINPWLEPQKLPLLDRGLLGELLYSGEPHIILDLPSRLRSDDPAFEYLQGMQVLTTTPQYENGVALNMGISVARSADHFPFSRIPMMVWQANLWGWAVRNRLLQQELQAAYNALDREMRAVGAMQHMLLPEKLPEIPGIDMAVHYQTSQSAGGDYYDVFECDDGRWGLIIADASGHGAPAAVIMAITHAIAHLHPGRGVPPGQTLAFINNNLVDRYTSASGSFVTAFYCLYDPATRSLTYARAGHNPPRLIRAGAAINLDGVGGLPLGIQKLEAFKETTIELRTDDLLLFYTDGITESRGPDGRMFGVPAMDAAINAKPNSPQQVVDDILQSLNGFTNNAAAVDDRTLLAMSVR